MMPKSSNSVSRKRKMGPALLRAGVIGELSLALMPKFELEMVLLN